MAVTLTKSLPSSSFYASSGAITVTLDGVTEISTHSKSTLLKIVIPQSKKSWTTNPSDIGKNSVIDLKKIEDTITIKAWLCDDDTYTAWDKCWKLRAMCTSGGPLTSLVIENLTFPTGSSPNYTIPQAFLEDVGFNVKPDDLGVINTNSNVTDVARIEVTLSFYIGNER